MSVRISAAFKPSRILAGYILALGVLAIGSLLITQLPSIILTSLILAVIAYVVLLLREHYFYFARYNPTAVNFEDRVWAVEIDGGIQRLELIHSLVWPFLIVAVFQCPYTGRRVKLLVLSDSCDKDSFRQLLVLFRSRKAFARA